MQYILDQTDKHYLYKWLLKRTGGGSPFTGTDYIALGIASGSGLEAVAIFHDLSGKNIFVDIAIDNPWVARPFFRLIGNYAFGQLGCKRLTLVAESTNVRAIKLHEKLGAIHEGRLVGAGRMENDILISRLTPDSRIWRKLKDGKQRQLSTAPA